VINIKFGSLEKEKLIFLNTDPEIKIEDRVICEQELDPVSKILNVMLFSKSGKIIVESSNSELTSDEGSNNSTESVFTFCDIKKNVVYLTEDIYRDQKIKGSNKIEITQTLTADNFEAPVSLKGEVEVYEPEYKFQLNDDPAKKPNIYEPSDKDFSVDLIDLLNLKGFYGRVKADPYVKP
jgi:hypothetical protein